MLAAERRRRLLLWIAGGVVLVLALGALIYWLAQPGAGGRIQSFPNQGAIHIQHGQAHPPYNSNPPTSGWHYADQVAPWGISSAPIPDEIQVHNLEHGGIVIQYDCPSGCPDVVSQLESFVNSVNKIKVVLAPRPGLQAATGHPIALTAWTHLAYLDTVDEPFIRQFYQRFKDQGPERVPDNM